MGHGFGTPRAVALPVYAESSVRAGYIVMVFDYRYFGESGGESRQLLDIGKQHEDWRNALAYTCAQEGVDRRRIVAWGTSLAGGHVLSLAGRGRGLRRDYRPGSARERLCCGARDGVA